MRKIEYYWLGLIMFLFSLPIEAIEMGHPRLYALNSEKEMICSRISNEAWARKSFEAIKNDIDKYVDLHAKDSTWILSRMAMYWKDGHHYTQCYLKNETWDYGEGNAPVPTVRMPGMRVWNEYVNVPLEDRIPYNETGDMMGVSILHPEAPPVKVPYKKSGHMIRSNNVEILTLAEKAAFVFWITNDIKYAKFSADIFNCWLAGTYYMQPILDPGKSSGGEGGWSPGGILGYYDYEQIHDDLALHAAVVYDFLYDYLMAHPSAHLSHIGKKENEVASEVFKRFIDLGFIRGGRNGNWNVNGWNMILRPILVLDSNKAYKDGHGREYYLDYLLNKTTQYHVDLTDMLANYDPVTGLWPESPGYGFGTIQMILDWSAMLRKFDIDIINSHPMLQKAAMAMFPWMDQRANMVVFGDSRGGAANFLTMENLMSYYQIKKDSENISRVASALQKGIQLGKYSRNHTDWTGICSFTDSIPTTEFTTEERCSYSPFHRFIVMKNGNLMANIYGGRKGSHLSANGLAVQLYGDGYALAPDASAYESYWSDDYKYHQSATGANTIIPGYTEGPISVNAMEPRPGDNEFTTGKAVSPFINFADVSAGEKRRTVIMYLTSKDRGYYVDFFRSEQKLNDYLFHNVGDSMSVFDSVGKEIRQMPVSKFNKPQTKEYNYFTDIRQTITDHNFYAEWQMPENLTSRLWMLGGSHRTIYQMNAPSTTMIKGLTPGNVSMPPHKTPALMVRQEDTSGESNPFMAVYESYKNIDPDILNVSLLKTNTGKALQINRKGDCSETVMSNQLNGKLMKSRNLKLDGLIGIVSKKEGKVTTVYMGHGKYISTKNICIKSDNNIDVSVYQLDNKWYVSSSGNAKVKIDGKAYSIGKQYNTPLR